MSNMKLEGKYIMTYCDGRTIDLDIEDYVDPRDLIYKEFLEHDGTKSFHNIKTCPNFDCKKDSWQECSFPLANQLFTDAAFQCQFDLSSLPEVTESQIESMIKDGEVMQNKLGNVVYGVDNKKRLITEALMSLKLTISKIEDQLKDI